MKLKNTTMIVLALILFVGTAAAQQIDFPAGCRSLPGQKTISRKDTPRTPKQIEADAMLLAWDIILAKG